MREKHRIRRVELSTVRTGLAAAAAAGGIMTAGLANSGHPVLWVMFFLILTAACAGGALVLGLTVPWSSTAPSSDDGVALPLWVRELRSDRRSELVTIVTGLQRNVTISQHAASEASERAEQASRRLWAAVDHAAASEEQVRGRMVADLHDGVAQMLLVAGYLVTEDDVDHEALRKHIVDTEVELRDLMTFALPPQLRHGSLGQSVRYLTDTLSTRRGLAVQWQWPRLEGAGWLNEAVAVTLYRFFQEALGNVVKHAGVDTARAGLRLDGEDGDVVVAWVEDDGVGFSPESVAPSASGHHIGLAMMGGRADMLGATLEVKSAPGEGTTMTLCIPPPPAGADRPIAFGTLD